MTFKRFIVVLVSCSVFIAQGSLAAVSQDEAEKLKSTLTPFGAERAGNKDGSIPEWKGGYTTVPKGYKSGDPRPDPFADEKPLYSITGQNVGKYAEKLTDGVKAMLKKYPSYRLDVYPTHRTAAAPEWVYKNTYENVTRAKTENNGLTVKGAYGGIPFPIPQTGNEVMWNHLLAWLGFAPDFQFRSFTIDSSGRKVMAQKAKNYQQYPYYDPNGTLATFKGDYWWIYHVALAPPVLAGESILVRDPVDQYGRGRQAWQYLVGQRRVRRAPAISYDTPNFNISGYNTWDEVYGFMGALDRFDWKILGKKEMYIPYNENKFLRGKADDILGPNFLNPDYVRWELHRVWVVEAKVAQGKRHVVARRMVYLDEDTWRLALMDGWDGKGQLWKSSYTLPVIFPEYPVVSAIMFGVYNLQTGAYAIDHMMNEMPEQYKSMPKRPDSFFTPEAMAGKGVR